MKKLVIYLTLGLSIFAQKITIQEAAEIALKNNKSIKISMKELENSKIDLDKSWKQGLFTVDFNSQSYILDNDVKEQHSAGLTLTQPLYTGGKVTSGVKYSKSSLQLSMYQLEKIKKDTVLSVIDSYILVLKLENTSEVLNSSKTTLDENLRTLDEKYKLRLATKPDLLEAQRSVLDVEAQILTNSNEINLAKQRLVKVLGLSAGTELDLTPFYVEEGFSKKIDLLVDMDKLKLDNSEYNISRLQTEMYKSQVDFAKSDYFPQISATVSYGTQNRNDFWDGYNLIDEGNLAAGVNFKWTLYDWGQVKDDVKKAKNSLEISQLKQDDTLEELQIKLNSNYLNITATEKTLEAKKKSVETAQEVYNLETERYNYGLITLRDLLNAESNLRQSRIDYLTSKLNYYYSISEYSSLFN